MNQPVVPNSFLFRFALPCPRVAKMPTAGQRLVNLPKSARLPFLGAMDGQPEFAQVWLGWNEQGIGVAFEVQGKEQAIVGDAQRWTAADGLSLWLDTRDTRTIHRASRFCQRFLLLAHDGSGEGVPTVRRQSIKRALEEPPAVDESVIRVARYALDEDGDVVTPAKNRPIKNYRMEAFLPAPVLHGFDPESAGRWGIFYRVRDQELGDQLLCGARELPYWEDPSLWATLVLKRDS